MNKIVENVKYICDKYPESSYNRNLKLLLVYLKEFHNLRFDGKYISTQDFINIDVNLDSIINAKYLLNLLEDNK